MRFDTWGHGLGELAPSDDDDALERVVAGEEIEAVFADQASCTE